MNRRFSVVLSVMLMLSLLPSLSVASNITFYFTGQVTEVPTFDSSFTFGDPVSGHFTFYSSTPDVYADIDYEPAFAYIGYYLGALLDFRIELGSYVATGTSGNIWVRNNINGFDGYQIDPVISGPDVNGQSLHEKMNFHINDISQTMFDNDSLPLTPPSEIYFYYNNTPVDYHNDLRIFFLPIDEWVAFSLSSMTIEPEPEPEPEPGSAPEPTTLALLVLGLVGLGFSRRKFLN